MNLQILVLTWLGLTIPVAVAGAHSSADAHSPKAQEIVNQDDPNLAFIPDYASDSATSCPKTLTGAKLRACLVKNGLASGDDVIPSAATDRHPDDAR